MLDFSEVRISPFKLESCEEARKGIFCCVAETEKKVKFKFLTKTDLTNKAGAWVNVMHIGYSKFGFPKCPVFKGLYGNHS